MTHLYRCWGRDGQLLYVGITDDMDVRRRHHARHKHWWGDVAKVTTMSFERRIEAQWAEWAVITTSGPTYNRSIAMPPAPDLVGGTGQQPVVVYKAESLWAFIRRAWSTDWRTHPAYEEPPEVPPTIRSAARSAVGAKLRHAAIEAQERVAPRERARAIIRDQGPIRPDAIVKQLGLEGYPTVRQTVQEWLRNDVKSGFLLRTVDGHYEWVGP